MGRTRAAAAPRSTSPGVPRRVSGPIRPGQPRPAAARPPRIHQPAVAAPARSSTTITDRLRALPDHRWLDTLLRSRAWIWLLGIALGGIVAMQVSMLKMNAGIGEAVQAGASLQHSNSALEEQLAELSSGTRIELTAQSMGLVTPDAGDVGYVTARPGIDPMRAAQNMTAPSQAARDLMAGGGTLPGEATSTATATGTAAPVGTATPVATATPLATAAPVATATPLATATPAIDGVVSAPQGP